MQINGSYGNSMMYPTFGSSPKSRKAQKDCDNKNSTYQPHRELRDIPGTRYAVKGTGHGKVYYRKNYQGYGIYGYERLEWLADCHRKKDPYWDGI